MIFDRALFISLIAVCVFSSVGLVNAELRSLPEGEVITIGVEESVNEWPPFEYYERVQGRKTETLTGVTVELTSMLFAEWGVKVRVVKYPWKRLLKELENGKLVQLIFPTSLNEERKQKYLVSQQVYSVTPAYFFLKDEFPEGLNIENKDDLVSYKPICGKLGYNYTNFDLSNRQVLRESHDYNHLFKLLKHRRCKLVLARHEILSAYALIGKPYITGEIGYSLAQKEGKEPFHYLISKNYEYAEELLMAIDDGLKRMTEQGKLDSLMNQYTEQYAN